MLFYRKCCVGNSWVVIQDATIDTQLLDEGVGYPIVGVQGKWVTTYYS